MREKLMRFMQGRYGIDQFGRFLSWVTVALLLISLFARGRIWFWIAFALLVYQYFRVFSRNIPKRYAENQAYLKATSRVRNAVASQKRELEQRRTHHIYRCPNCRQKIRVPRGKGKIEIRCPKCQTTFVKKS